MADEEKKVNEEAEGGEAKEGKKESKLSSFFKKTKENFNASVLEGKIETAFNKANIEYAIYTQGKMFPERVSGFLTDGNKLTVFGEVEVENYAVIISDKTEVAYYAVGTAPATVSAQVEGETYERPGTTITLDENVEEVNVVKAGDRYFLYKGEPKKKK